MVSWGRNKMEKIWHLSCWFFPQLFGRLPFAWIIKSNVLPFQSPPKRLLKREMNEVPEEDVVIQNRRTKCAVCGVGDLKLDNKVQMMVYSRSGMKRVTHQVRRCNNRNPACRALHGQGYHHEKKHRIYENYALKNDILVTGVSINSKNGVFYKAQIWGLSLRMQNWVFIGPRSDHSLPMSVTN